MVIVEGLNDRGARLGGDLVRSRFSIIGGRASDDDGRALSSDPRDLDGGSVLGHRDCGGDVKTSSGHRDRLRVIPGAVGDDPFGPSLCGEATDRVECSTGLEGADVLQILSLQIELASCLRFEKIRTNCGRTDNLAGEAPRGLDDVSAAEGGVRG
jgi:hypothetical protein